MRGNINNQGFTGAHGGEGPVALREVALWGQRVGVPLVDCGGQPVECASSALWPKLRGMLLCSNADPATCEALAALDAAVVGGFALVEARALRMHVRRLRPGSPGAKRLIAAVLADLKRRIAVREIESESKVEQTQEWPATKALGRNGRRNSGRRRARGVAVRRGCHHPIVEQVRARLPDGQLVLVGGLERPEQRRQLEEAFGRPIRWCKLREHGPIDPAIALISSKATGVVCVLQRLCGHQHAAETVRLCRTCGKPVIRVGHAFGVAAVARAMLDQLPVAA